MFDIDARQKIVQDNRDAEAAYRKAFNREAPWLFREVGSLEEVTAILRRCIEEGKPYRHPYPEQSEEVRELIYAQEDYLAMFNEHFDTWRNMGLGVKKMTEIMRQCIKEGKPQVLPPLPEGVLL